MVTSKQYDDAQKAACVGKDCEDDNPLNLPEYQEQLIYMKYSL